MIPRLALPLLALGCAVGAAAQTPPDGTALYAPCKVCHTIDKGGRNLVGPNLHSIVGRTAGTAPGYAYSPAMKAYAKAWTPALLDAYLADPRKVVPGTKMIYMGVKDPAKRAALVAYLQGQ